jgi:hypothetical protein
MMEIEVTGTTAKAIIDDEDFSLISSHKWSFSRKTKYPRRRNKYGETVYMHRLIMGLNRGDKRCVDHINGNVLDNRRSNLRICTRQQNACNKRNKALPRSGFRGVRKTGRRWQAVLHTEGKTKIIGSFTNILDAAHAYDKAAIKSFGEFACTNTAMGLL